MLNGLDPIIIFSFFKRKPTITPRFPKYPNVSEFVDKFELPPIPIYLSESITGLYIDTEEKNIDISTAVETLRSGDEPFYSQKGIGSTIAINLLASKDSIGLALLLPILDQLFSRVTSKEYSVTYLHGAITLFNGLLHSFSVNQDSNTDLIHLKLELSKDSKPKAPQVTPGESSQQANLNDSNKITGGTLPKAGGASGPGATFHNAPVRSIPIRST
jgi:hypothetical protein